MRERPIPLGGINFAKTDFDSLTGLVDRVGPGEWDAWLEKNVKELTAYLCQIGKFGLADEVWHHFARLRSFQTLIAKLSRQNYLTESEKAQVEMFLKQFDPKSLLVLSIWLTGIDLEKNETTGLLIKMLEDQRKLEALKKSGASPAAEILQRHPGDDRRQRGSK